MQLALSKRKGPSGEGAHVGTAARGCPAGQSPALAWLTSLQQPCHPERSICASKASANAQSKDPYPRSLLPQLKDSHSIHFVTEDPEGTSEIARHFSGGRPVANDTLFRRH